MSTPHNEAKLGDIAKTVIMPGDPLRAKYIAENFLENARLVSQVRGMYAYTGTYQGKQLTIMAHGMGMPSMGIYSYELYKFYEVENIIRIAKGDNRAAKGNFLSVPVAGTSDGAERCENGTGRSVCKLPDVKGCIAP